MPADNRDTRAAWAFHNATKYVMVPVESGLDDVLMGTPPHLEDAIWQRDMALEPYPFKVYETVPPIAIPTDFGPSPLPALDAITLTGAEPGSAVPDLATLARIARFANGPMGRTHTRGTGTVVEFRTSGATGARYHLEIYFVCGRLADLDAGLYHYAAHDQTLRQLRAGDFRAALVEATGGEPAVAAAPVVLALTSTFWRNAWRYKARAYRHAFWDAGTMLANVLAVAAAGDLPARLVLGYADRQVNDLLGVDGRNEATIALCALGSASAPVPAAPEVSPLALHVRPISPRQVDFPAIGMLHSASELRSGAEAAAWRAEPPRGPIAPPRSDPVRLRPLPDGRAPETSIEDLILSRRSIRRYDTAVPTPFETFSTLLDRSSRPFAVDCLAAGERPPHDLYLIVNQVEGLAPGIYVHHPETGVVELLREGDFRAEAQHVAADQAYAAAAHVNCYYLTDLGAVLERHGNRGYRVAQLLSALSAGKLHLATHALGAGAVGSTSPDDDVTALFSPHGAGKSFLFVTVFGKRRGRRTPMVGMSPATSMVEVDSREP
jgi:SagB-type dehydrogenase family enzyme